MIKKLCGVIPSIFRYQSQKKRAVGNRLSVNNHLIATVYAVYSQTTYDRQNIHADNLAAVEACRGMLMLCCHR